jgi:4'-phosphopantetheinyl transferase
MCFTDISTKSSPVRGIPMCADARCESAHIDQSGGLRPGTVAVVRVPIGSRPQGERLLSEHERERAARLRPGRSRAEFVTVRAALRMALATLLGEPPDRLPIELDERGKPRLGRDGPHFSVTHTSGLGLIALAPDREVGVDAELIDAERVTPRRERGALAAAERRLAEGLPAERRAVSFFQRWSCKEAVAKATGQGIALPFRQLVVQEATLAGRPAELAAAGTTVPAVSVAAIDAGPGYAAAVAAHGDWQAPVRLA